MDSEVEVDFTRARLAWSDRIAVGDLNVDADFIINSLKPHMTDERLKRLEDVVDSRSLQLVPVLENIYDRGNVSAVMRSAEAFGFLQMALIDAPGARFKTANRVARGADKWLDVHSFSYAHEAVGELKGKGYQIWATDLNTDDTIDSIDFTKPTAIVLGNEKDGVSPEMLKQVDGKFKIPMHGFSQSFNISVAGALVFYHAYLKIRELGEKAKLSETQRRQVLANYYLRCFDNPENILKQKL